MKAEKSLYDLDLEEIEIEIRRIAGDSDGYARFVKFLREEPTEVLIEEIRKFHWVREHCHLSASETTRESTLLS